MTTRKIRAVPAKAMVPVVMGALLLSAVACRGDTAQEDPTGGGDGSGSVQQSPSPTDGVGDPPREVINTLDPDFDATHRITLEVHDGYGNHGGFAWLKSGLLETGVSVWVVAGEYGT